MTVLRSLLEKDEFTNLVGVLRDEGEMINTIPHGRLLDVKLVSVEFNSNFDVISRFDGGDRFTHLRPDVRIYGEVINLEEII